MSQLEFVLPENMDTDKYNVRKYMWLNPKKNALIRANSNPARLLRGDKVLGFAICEEEMPVPESVSGRMQFLNSEKHIQKTADSVPCVFKFNFEKGEMELCRGYVAILSDYDLEKEKAFTTVCFDDSSPYNLCSYEKHSGISASKKHYGSMSAGERIGFSASYTNSAHNFVIDNLPKPRETEYSIQDSFVSILKNILQRGGKKTKPSEYLSRWLGTPDVHEPLYFLSDTTVEPRWEATIRGNHDGYNPALDFYYNIIPEYIDGATQIRQLILPEAELSLILDDESGLWAGQSVDFYLPQASLVVEIDGAQHQHSAQMAIDMRRDESLQQKGIIVVRIPAKSVTKRDSILATQTQRIQDLIDNRCPSALFSPPDEGNEKAKETRLGYEYVIRFQMLLLSLLERHAISLTDEKWAFDVQESHRKYFTFAFNDLINFFENLYRLSSNPFKAPKLIFSHNGCSVQIFINRRWDETKRSGIAIFTDYYDSYDYFSASCNRKIDYQINWPLDDNRESALLFFLKNLFNYNSFNEGQLPIIVNALNLKDTIGILPTGGGKSLCYFYTCLLQPSVHFSVCPIISLLMDQRKNLEEFGVTRVSDISSVQDADVKAETVRNFGRGKYLIIWIAPERFQSAAFREELNKANHRFHFGYAVIDEVHCLSEWGHDFRTSYLTLIKTIRTYCPQATLLGLTATASQAVLTDLKVEFGVDSTGVKATPSLSRPELKFVIQEASPEKSKYDLLEDIIEDTAIVNKDTIGVVFTTTKSNKAKEGCKDVEQKLESMRPDLVGRIDTYHGSLSNAKKMEVQQNFMDDQYSIMTATKAFGMGINKPDIRYTIHFGMPWSVEAFYQEAGRAGRDHNPATCFILYNPESKENQKTLDEIFSPNTPVENILPLNERLSHDLNTILFLWAQNNRGIESDVQDVLWFMSGYSSEGNGTSEYIVHTTWEHNKSRTERALYHLRQLGIVDDWIIVKYGQDAFRENYFRPTVFQVSMAHFYSIDTVYENMIKYVSKYDAEFLEEAERNRKYISIILEANATNYIEKYSRMLITWIYDHIVFGRREAIKNIMELCDLYAGDDSDDFRERVEMFLAIDEKNGLLDSIVKDPSNWRLWFNAFFEKTMLRGMPVTTPLQKDGFKAMAMSCARYRESYANNTGINLIYVVSRAITQMFDAGRDPKILANCIDYICRQTEADTILNKLVSLLLNHRENEFVKYFIDAICSRRPDYAVSLYKQFKDDVSLAYFLSQASEMIVSSIGGVSW